MHLSAIFDATAKVGRSIAVLAVPLALAACATTSLPTAQCMEGTSIAGPANLVSGQHISYNETCGNTMMNKTLVQVGNQQNDVGLITMGMTAEVLQNPQLARAGDIARTAIANPNGSLRCVVGEIIPGTNDRRLSCETPLVTVTQSVRTNPPAP